MSSMHEWPPYGVAPAPAPPSAPDLPHLRLVPDVALDFDDAVRQLTPRLQRYATRRLGDAHEAEELVQEALLRAYTHREELGTEDDLAAWTTVVVGRLVIDRLRVRGRSINVAEVPEGTRVGRDTADVVVARDEARMALDALDAMPARQAAVLWAREVEGQGYDEIGRRFGMTEPAVRSILTRARKGLRKEYALRGGTLPVAGLSALAPWVVGMRWADRLRRAVGRVTAPAALGVVSLSVLGGALGGPLWGGAAPSPVVVQSVASAPAAQALTDRAVAQVAVPPTASARTAPARGSAVRSTAVPTVLEKRVHVSCTSYAGAGVGSESCAPPAEDESSLYLAPSLPDNPTGVRDVGVKSDKLDCSLIPSTPVARCTTQPSTGGTP